MTTIGTVELIAKIDTGNYKRGAKEIEKSNKDIKNTTDDADKSSGKFGKSLGNVASFAAKAFAVATVAVLGFGAAALKSYGDSQVVAAQTNAVIKSTGAAAGVTAKEVASLSSALQKTTRFSDETIASAQNMLLTFTEIGKDVFPDATKTVLDMSQALGQDTKNSAIQLGKALNDPIRGVTALRKVGVTFNDTQQETIKNLVETGQKAEAQRLILAELRKEFGGSAEAAGKTLPGQLDILKNRFDDVMESIGGAIAGSGVLSVLAKVLGNVGDALEKIDFSQLIKGIQDSEIVKGLAIGFKIFMDILKPLIEFTKGLFTELSKNKEVMDGLKIIIFGLAAALGAVIIIGVAFIGILGLIAAGIANLVGQIGRFVSQVVIGFNIALKAVVAYYSTLIVSAANAWSAIQRFFGGIGNWFAARFNEARNAVVNIFNGLVNFVAGVPGRIVSQFYGVGVGIANAIRNAINAFLRLPLRIPSITVAGKKIGGQTLIPALADGGIVSSATLALIGEGSEPEAVIPLSKLDSMMNGEVGGKTVNHIGTINIGTEVDGDRWISRLTRESELAYKGLSRGVQR